MIIEAECGNLTRLVLEEACLKQSATRGRRKHIIVNFVIASCKEEMVWASRGLAALVFFWRFVANEHESRYIT
jgi:hypothetical protein